MNPPEPAVVWALLGLVAGGEMAPAGADGVTLPVPGAGAVPVAVLDELEARGLVAVTARGAEPTDRGRYWARKWGDRMRPGFGRAVAAGRCRLAARDL